MDAMVEPILYKRFVRGRLEEALEDTPVVLIHGPRQVRQNHSGPYGRRRGRL